MIIAKLCAAKIAMGGRAPSGGKPMPARLAAVVLMAASLAGCASQGGATQEDNIGSFMVAPGKYQFYPCPNLAQTLALLKVREAELAALIEKAGPGTGGTIVSAVAYQPEYSQTRGNIIAVRKEAEAKKCPAQIIEPPPARPAPPRRAKR